MRTSGTLLRTIIACALLAGAACASAPPPGPAAAPAAPAGKGDLLLRDFAPRSMLQVPVTEVTRARHPVIDVHQHVNDGRGRAMVPPERLIEMMDAHNVRAMVILTGGWGEGLQKVVDTMVKPYPGRFHVFTMVDWSRVDEPGFGEAMAAQIRDAVARGARGLKVLKDLGLGVRDRAGRLIAVDDPRLDPIWRECGKLRIPVAIHTGDPEAFFTPVDRHNERYEELQAHPGWSFHGKDYPTKQALREARDRVFARHPDTTFISLHVGNFPENLDAVSDLLDRYPNVVVETGARQAELGRQPRRARAFFLKYQDRILFGSDNGLNARNGYGRDVYRSWFRFLETADEYFDYYNAPAQGRWKIYGLELPDEVLRKVYHANAERILAAAGRR